MRLACLSLIALLSTALLAGAAELSNASSQDLLAVYKQLRALQGGSQAASAENVVFKRDSATFTFIGGRIAFAEPVAGQVLAAHFQGEGKFELAPPSPIDQRQLARFAGSGKLVDTFSEAIFFFTDDTFAELNKLMKVRATPKAAEAPFAGKQKQYQNDFNNWIENVRKRNPTIRNLAARMLADLTDSSSKGFFLAEFNGTKMGDLLFHISWNRDALLFPLISMSDEVFLLHLNPGDYFEWISGFHLSSEYAKSQHPDHLVHQVQCPAARIDLQILKDNTISAKAEMEFVAAESPVRVVPLNLRNVLRISSIENSAGKQLAFIQEDKKLDNDPWVILDSPARAGQKDKITVSYKEDSTYETRIINDKGGSLYSVEGGESWYPTFGRANDRTQYEIRARSPKKLVFIASGAPVKTEKEKDDLVTTWKTEIPVGSVGFNYGDFVEASQSAQNVKLTAYAGRALPNVLQGVKQRSAQMTIMGSGRSDAGYMPSGLDTASMVKTAAGTGIGAVTFFEFLFGNLPMKTLSMVQQPDATTGGWPNMALVPYTSFLDSTIMNQMGFLSSGEARENYRLNPVHALAGQWLGHMVGDKTYHDQWITIGGADFASGMYLRQFASGEMNNYRDIRRKWLLSKNSSGYRPIDAGPIWISLQLNEHDQLGNSGLVSRYKGSYIFEMLRVLMYDTQMKNPDARFIAAMREFHATYAGQDASTEDLRRIIEKNAGRSLEWFFNEWIYGSETPAYDFGYQLSSAEGGQTDLSITLTQSGVSDSFRMQLPLYVVVNGAQQYLGLIGVSGTKPLKTSMKLPFRPEKVLLDPDRSILAEIHQ